MLNPPPPVRRQLESSLQQDASREDDEPAWLVEAQNSLSHASASDVGVKVCASTALHGMSSCSTAARDLLSPRCNALSRVMY